MKKFGLAAAAAATSSSSYVSKAMNNVRNPSHHKPLRFEDEVTQHCLQSGSLKIEDALHLFDRMLNAHPKPSISSFNILLTRIIRMRNPSSSTDYYATAFSLFNKMNRADGISPTVVTYRAAIDCCSRMNCVDIGFSIFGTMLKRGWSGRTVIFSILVKGLCLEKMISEASMVLDKMLHSGKEWMMPNVITFSTLIKGFCREGDMCRAAELFERMSDLGIRPDVVTYSTLIHGYSVLGRWKESMGVFKDMVDKGLPPNVVTFTTLFILFASKEKLLKHTNYSI